MRVLLVTGKGGVGKTTHALATAFGAAAHGHRVCVLSADPAHSLGDALARPVGAAAVRVAKGVVAREVNAQHELDRSWGEIQQWLRALLRDGANDLVAEELLVFPGLEELLALRAVREAEATGEFDVCVVDCAPTGATLRMLRFPDALKIFMENFFDLERRGARLLRPLVARTHAGRLLPREEFFDAVERLFGEVEDVRQILLDEARTSARLVVNPARVVVDETRRAYAYLCLYGVATDAVIVNRLLPEIAAGGWFGRWAAKERDELAEAAPSETPPAPSEAFDEGTDPGSAGAAADEAEGYDAPADEPPPQITAVGTRAHAPSPGALAFLPSPLDDPLVLGVVGSLLALVAVLGVLRSRSARTAEQEGLASPFSSAEGYALPPTEGGVSTASLAPESDMGPLFASAAAREHETYESERFDVGEDEAMREEAKPEPAPYVAMTSAAAPASAPSYNASDLEGLDMRVIEELERRLAHLETRLEEVVDAKERLERHVAAQTEELRVQRAAIARTQRVLRGVVKSDDLATEPAPKV